MKDFQDLFIHIQDLDISQFANLLTGHCGDQWKRAYDNEKNALPLEE